MAIARMQEKKKKKKRDPPTSILLKNSHCISASRAIGFQGVRISPLSLLFNQPPLPVSRSSATSVSPKQTSRTRFSSPESIPSTWLWFERALFRRDWLCTVLLVVFAVCKVASSFNRSVSRPLSPPLSRLASRHPRVTRLDIWLLDICACVL